MIEQIRYDTEQHRDVLLQRGIGDRRGEMRFAAAVAAEQDEPALRVRGILDGACIRALNTRHGAIKTAKRLVAQAAEIRHTLKFVKAAIFFFALFALAGDQHAEVRVSVGNVERVIADAAANPADRLRDRSRLRLVGRVRRIRRRCSDRYR